MSVHGREPVRAVVAQMATGPEIITILLPGQPDPPQAQLDAWAETYRMSGPGQSWGDPAANWGLPVEVSVQTIKGRNPWRYLLDNVEYLQLANRPFYGQDGSQDGSDGVYVTPPPC